MYNLEVEDCHTYFVGEYGVLVHNVYQSVYDKPIQDHHIATKYSESFKALFEKYGISINNKSNRVKLPHQGRHAPEYHQYIEYHLKAFDKIADGE